MIPFTNFYYSKRLPDQAVGLLHVRSTPITPEAYTDKLNVMAVAGQIGPGTLGARAWPVQANYYPGAGIGNFIRVNHEDMKTSWEYTVETPYSQPVRPCESVENTNPERTFPPASASHSEKRPAIDALISGIRDAFSDTLNLRIGRPVPLVLSRGTTMHNGFRDRFEAKLRAANLHVAISEVRLAPDPLNTVAKGLLVEALAES